MYWQAPMLGRWVTHDALRVSFASVFALDPSCIDIVDYPHRPTGPIPPEPRILLERFDHDGPFPFHLNIFLAGDALERPVTDLAGTLHYARALARQLGVTMLFGTGPIGYEEQIRVAPDGTVDIVELDGDELDADRFVIVGSRPFAEQPAESVPSRAS
jgi:hypothetical protein